MSMVDLELDELQTMIVQLALKKYIANLEDDEQHLNVDLTITELLPTVIVIAKDIQNDIESQLQGG